MNEASRGDATRISKVQPWPPNTPGLIPLTSTCRPAGGRLVGWLNEGYRLSLPSYLPINWKANLCAARLLIRKQIAKVGENQDTGSRFGHPEVPRQ